MKALQTKSLTKVGRILGTIEVSDNQMSPYRQEQFDLELCLTFDQPEISEKSLSQLPDPKAWSEKLAIGIAEVLIGDRPAFQLIRWLAFDVYCSVERRALQPPPAGNRARPLLRCVQISQVNENVINVSAVIQKGVRGRAMAMRLVAESDRWRCTELLVA
jgi:hypothetical protein